MDSMARPEQTFFVLLYLLALTASGPSALAPAPLRALYYYIFFLLVLLPILPLGCKDSPQAQMVFLSGNVHTFLTDILN